MKIKQPFTGIILLPLLYFSVSCNGAYAAQPSIQNIEGKINSNQTITIYGNDFGTKSRPTPLIWDDFENGTPNKSVATGGIWKTAGTPPAYSSENNRTGSNKNVKAVLSVSSIDGNYHDIFYKDGLDFSSKKAFFSFWLRFDSGSGDDYYQIKTWRLVRGGEASEYPSIACFPHPGDKAWYYYTLTRSDKSGKSFTFSPFPNHRWINVTAEIFTGDPKKENGSIKIWHEFRTVVDAKGINILRNSNQFNAARFGEYIGNGGLTATNHFDNIYVDNSWARVEIGNNSKYSSCTQREILIPTYWSKGTIKAKVNTGAFASGQKAYLFVVDPNGTPSSGKAVTIGSTVAADKGTLEVPPPPTEVTISGN